MNPPQVCPPLHGPAPHSSGAPGQTSPGSIMSLSCSRLWWPECPQGRAWPVLLRLAGPNLTSDSSPCPGCCSHTGLCLPLLSWSPLLRCHHVSVPPRTSGTSQTPGSSGLQSRCRGQAPGSQSQLCPSPAVGPSPRVPTVLTETKRIQHTRHWGLCWTHTYHGTVLL